MPSIRWRTRESNSLPLACKASALPYELDPHDVQVTPPVRLNQERLLLFAQ